MVERSSTLTWARSAQFVRPLRWGEVEAQILRRSPAPETRVPAWAFALAAIGWVARGVVAIIGLGAPVLALVLIGLGDVEPAEDAQGSRLATVLLTGSGLVLVSALATWWSTGRRRSTVFLVAGVIAAASSAASLAFLLPERPSDPLTLAATATMLLGLSVAAVMVVSGPEGSDPRRTPPRRGPRSATTRSRYEATRGLVLDILMRRGVVTIDEADRIRMLQLPLGYWEELDDVDEKERRRILEMRLVGWRDFDSRDRRSWPPSTVRP